MVQWNSFFSHYCSAVKQLLAAGADPNLDDEFSSINQVSKEKGIHPIHGMFKPSKFHFVH